MAGYGYGYGGMYGGLRRGSFVQEYEQERIGFGPQGYGIYEQDTEVIRNPYTGAMTVVQENEFMPIGGLGYRGFLLM